MNIGIDIRCLMEKERSGVQEYTMQLLNDMFSKNEEENLGNEYFLFWNSWHDVSNNLSPRQKISNIDNQEIANSELKNRDSKKTADNYWCGGIPKWNYSFVNYCGFRWPNKLLNASLRFLKYPKLDRLIKSNVKRQTSNIDLFIFPNQNFYALSHGVKKIVVVHDLSPEIYPECFSFKSRLWHKLVNLRKMAQEADEIIAVSENTKLDLVNLYKIDPNKILVNYPKVSGVRCQVSGVKNNYILFLGTIELRKNVIGLLKAYELLITNYQLPVTKLPELWIAGKPGYKNKEVFKFWRGMKARDSVKFLGYVSEDEKWKLLQTARAFVYPSFYEGFGLPILEAISVGTPVITSPISSIPEVVKEKGILVDPNRVEDLAKALELAAPAV